MNDQSPTVGHALRPRFWPAAGVVAVSLAVYRLTLAPTVTLEDSGSFIAAAHCLGVAHPPGYPLWCLLAHAFTHLPLGTAAWCVNFCSAVCAAAASLLLFLIARRLTRSTLAAWAAALAFAFSRVFWSQAVIAEVYTLNALLFAGLVYCALRWRAGGQPGWLYGLSFIAGLGMTNHPVFALVAPAPCIWALTARKRLPRWRTALVSLALFMAALSIYAYIPWRARANPPVNWGNPVTWRAVAGHILRRAYYTEPERVRYVGTSQDALRFMAAAVRQSAAAPTWPATVLALCGCAVLIGRRRDMAAMTLAVVIVNIMALNLILRGTAVPDEYFTRRVFYIPAQMMAALWLAVAVKRLLVFARMKKYAVAGHCLAAAFLLLPFWAMAANWAANDRARDTLARDFGMDLLASAPPGAGLFFVHDEFLFPSLYLKVVEGLRPDLQFVESPFCGYSGRKLSAVLSDFPPNDALRKYYPFLKGARAIPWGLAYRLVQDSVSAPDAIFCAGAVRDPPAEAKRDPSARLVFAAYACYHARAGAATFLAGERERAASEWERSELLKGGDPYAHYVLALMYRRCGLYPERQKALLQTALSLYRRQYSPAEFRFYPLTEQEIAAQIEDGEM